jgi:hypothetical protein
MRRSQPLSSFSATAFQHEAPVLAGHASPEAVCLCASSVVWLKGALRHRNEFSLKTKRLRLIAALVYVKKRGTGSVIIRVNPWSTFNNVVYQNDSSSMQNSQRSNGDQVALFYCRGSLDNSESSMLVSAGFESHRPVNN